MNNMYYLNEFNQICKIGKNFLSEYEEKIIDELIIPIISILNRKGYITKFSCSGHILDDVNNEEIIRNDNCYIAFEQDKQTLLRIGFRFPKDFEIEEDNSSDGLYKTCIRKIYSDDKDRYIQILDTMKYLYTWANSLPETL